MQEDQIVARAQQIVATRREQRRAPLGGGTWVNILLGLVLTVLLAFLLYPAPMPQKLLAAMGGVCGLRPAHSYFAGSIQLPLEARMTGIYGGVSITLGWLLLRRCLGATRAGTRTVLAWVVAAVARPPAKPPTTLFAHPRELLIPLGLCGLFGLLVVSQQPWGYYPITVLSVGGIVVALAGALLLPVLLIGGWSDRITTPRQILAPGALALLSRSPSWPHWPRSVGAWSAPLLASERFA